MGEEIAYRLPENISNPVADYYIHVEWDFLKDWKVVRFQTTADGSCLFHAIANALYKAYHTEKLGNSNISRKDFVHQLRKHLSEQLAKPISGDKSHYSYLAGGKLEEFAKEIPEFEINHMISQLNSKSPIGYGYIEFISDIIGRDLYILDFSRKDIYVTDELRYSITGERNAIVLLYHSGPVGHYELVGIRKPDGSFDTHFKPTHTLIQKLNRRVNEIIGGTFDNREVTTENNVESENGENAGKAEIDVGIEQDTSENTLENVDIFEDNVETSLQDGDLL